MLLWGMEEKEMPEIIVQGRTMAPKWTSHCYWCGCIARWSTIEVQGMEERIDMYTTEIRYVTNCPHCERKVWVEDAANAQRDTHS